MAELKKICKQPLVFEIVSFFHENPQALDTAHSIAAWLNHDREEIKKALELLGNQGILTTHQTGGTTAYAFTQEKEIVKKIDKFLKQKVLSRRKKEDV